MIYIGTTVMRVNQAKLRREHDDWHEVAVPLSDDPPAAPPPVPAPLKAEVTDASIPDAFRLVHLKGKVDVQELFSGSARVSSACADNGLRVAAPSDLKTGFDLATREGQKRAWNQIEEQQPTVVFMAPLCSPWSSFKRHTGASEIGETKGLTALSSFLS